MVLAGALPDPADRGMLLFSADSPAVAEAFARSDPYVRHALVHRWEVRAWTTVWARTPRRPSGPKTGPSG